MRGKSDLKLGWSHSWDSLSSDRISEFDWFVFVAYLSIWKVTDIYNNVAWKLYSQ